MGFLFLIKKEGYCESLLEDTTEAAARTAEEHIAHKSADSDLVDTIDLSRGID